MRRGHRGGGEEVGKEAWRARGQSPLRTRALSIALPLTGSREERPGMPAPRVLFSQSAGQILFPDTNGLPPRRGLAAFESDVGFSSFPSGTTLIILFNHCSFLMRPSRYLWSRLLSKR